MSMAVDFQVEDVFPYKEGVVVLGRCVSGSVIAGIFFTRVKRDKCDDVEVYKQNIGSVESRAVRLMVKEIQYFSSKVDALHETQSGGIYLVGDGADLIFQGDRLVCDIESAEPSVNEAYRS